MNKLTKYLEQKLEKFQSLPPLLFRLTLAYVFLGPFLQKIQHFPATVAFFSQLGIPFPEISTYLVVVTEGLAIVLLFFGLGTRLICIPLIVLLVVAIMTVHFKNGFSAAQGGFEIPFYYLLMVIYLFIVGPGSVSVDQRLYSGRK